MWPLAGGVSEALLSVVPGGERVERRGEAMFGVVVPFNDLSIKGHAVFLHADTSAYRVLLLRTRLGEVKQLSTRLAVPCGHQRM